VFFFFPHFCRFLHIFFFFTSCRNSEGQGIPEHGELAIGKQCFFFFPGAQKAYSVFFTSAPHIKHTEHFKLLRDNHQTQSSNIVIKHSHHQTQSSSTSTWIQSIHTLPPRGALILCGSVNGWLYPFSPTPLILHPSRTYPHHLKQNISEEIGAQPQPTVTREKSGYSLHTKIVSSTLEK